MNSGEDLAARDTTHGRIFRPYGIAVRVACADERVMELAAESFAPWDMLADADTSLDAAAQCEILLDRNITSELIAPRYLVQGGYLWAGNSHCEMFADRALGDAKIHVAQEYVQSFPTQFQRHFLECAVQFIATREDRVPVHASAAIIDGRPVVIIGASNSGKSTLLYALARSNVPVLAEESVCVSYQDAFGLWGLAREIGLREEALSFFSELREKAVIEQPNGKRKYLAPIASTQRAYPRQGGPVTLVFLESADGQAIVQITPEEAARRLHADRESGFDIAPDYADAVAALVRNADAFLLRRRESPIVLAEILVRHLRGPRA